MLKFQRGIYMIYEKIEFFKSELQDWNRNKIKLNAILCIAGVAALCILARAFSNTNNSFLPLTPTYLLQQSVLYLNLAKQDNDLITACTHSAQGITYLTLARRLASDSSLEKQSKINPSELEKVLNDILEKKKSN
jgi:hypothetical protein